MSAFSTAMELTTSSWTSVQPPTSSRGTQILTGLGNLRLKEAGVKLKQQPPQKLSRILTISGKSGDKNEDGPVPYLARQEAKLFARESIGAEHGEGFATFRTTGPLHVDVDFLNDRMKEKGLQRIRYAMKPDEAFGLIFSWDNVLLNTHALRLGAWTRLAAEEEKPLPTTPERQRQLLYMDARTALHKILDWGDEFTDVEIKRLSKRLATLYSEELSRVQAPMEGLSTWLGALFNAGVPCAITSSMDRLSLLAVLQRLGLLKYFRAFVTEEDGMDSIAHMFLSAAVKLDRPPAKCVVFEDDPRGVAAAHNCTMKAVALIGSHPAYELTQADLAVSGFSDLSVMNLRRLFANKGAEFMDLQKQADPKKPAKRRLMMDTLF
ncbi:hypothetical protein KC19_6G102900 [Ceratodon purpureus]|uniref:Uncharacterized protein n=1 Tax=Ceratodon purpureus TaxID=3225 RepID=A0A8T0HCS1_CERPU|nr:hypothetical protein KC19_6G102900 [Ceratodon purpureus]